MSSVWHENTSVSSICFCFFLSLFSRSMFPVLLSLLLLAFSPSLFFAFYYIFPLINTNIHTADRSRLILTQWRDFDSWSETEESDEDIRRYTFFFFFLLPVSDVMWSSFCSHLHFPSLLWLPLHSMFFLQYFRLCCSWTHTYKLHLFLLVYKV